MKTKLFLFCALMGMTLSFAACGDETDGDWDPMEWSGYSKKNDIVINVSAEGGINLLHCKNYSSFWLSYVNEMEDSIRQHYTIYMMEDPHKISTDWAEIECSGSQLQVTMKPNDSDKERTLEVSVTAGDIFDKITFIQARK